MKRSTNIKICGLTKIDDLMLAQKLGADYFGFILYNKSPRSISIKILKKLVKDININQCVVVDVLPQLDKLEILNDIGFKNFQIHIPKNTDFDTIERLSNLLGKNALWLAPELKTLTSFNSNLLKLADTIIIDSYSKSQIGGTGRPGDWIGFKQLNEKYPEISWGLAGGLNAKNINDAQLKSGASLLDINSGIEKTPGIKDHNLMVQLFKTLT